MHVTCPWHQARFHVKTGEVTDPPALDQADLANHDLLNAIRVLAFTIEGRVRRPVDYKNLGSEELGSVYESLLDLQPVLQTEGHLRFGFDHLQGGLAIEILRQSGREDGRHVLHHQNPSR